MRPFRGPPEVEKLTVHRARTPSNASIGLNNHGFRYYDPATGRYLTRDPLGYTDGLNPYLYVHNNPINHIDPLGLEAMSTWQMFAWNFGVVRRSNARAVRNAGAQAGDAISRAAANADSALVANVGGFAGGASGTLERGGGRVRGPGRVVSGPFRRRRPRTLPRTWPGETTSPKLRPGLSSRTRRPRAPAGV